MSDGARQRLTGKSKKAGQGDTTPKKKTLTEEEAVNKASNRWIGKFCTALVVVLFLPVIVLVLIPSPLTVEDYPQLTPPAPFEGPLTLNNDLAFSEKIYEGQVIGPESLVVDGDNIYTGTMDGWVNHLYQGEVRRLVRFGQEPCGGIENENTCGRPLGLRMDKSGHLLVCDAYFGLFRVNVTTGEYETLYKSSTPVNGKASKFLNDLDVEVSGKIYFTESSTRWHRNQFIYSIFEGDSSGRLLVYDPVTKATTQLQDNLMFPNGVQLTPDQSALLVSELGRARILRYDFKTKRFSIWADGLPGIPDNIRYDKNTQTYWVGMASARFTDKFSVIDYLSDKPRLRSTLGKIVTVSNLETFTSSLKFLGTSEPEGLVIEFDEGGKMISSLQDKNGDVVKGVSEIHYANGIFYMGSYHQNYIAKLDWKKVTNP